MDASCDFRCRGKITAYGAITDVGIENTSLVDATINRQIIE